MNMILLKKCWEPPTESDIRAVEKKDDDNEKKHSQTSPMGVSFFATFPDGRETFPANFPDGCFCLSATSAFNENYFLHLQPIHLQGGAPK